MDRRAESQITIPTVDQSPVRPHRPGASRLTANIGWNILGNAGGKVVGPLFQLLIARLLLPEDFGVFAVAFAWLAVFEIGKDMGLTQAIVVHRGARAEGALQFTVQLATASVFFLVTLAASPIAARHFGRPELSSVLPLVGLVAFMSAVADPIVTGCVVRQDYRRLALRQIVSPLASGAAGLFLAYRGYGAHALAIGLLIGHAAGALSLIPGGQRSLSLRFDWKLMANLMPLGKHIVLQRFFGFLVGQADSFIVGTTLGSSALGLYRMGHTLTFLIPTASVSQAEQVVFTELSASRHPEDLRRRYNVFTNTAGPLLLLYSVTVYAVAPWLVPLALGPQWGEAVPLMQIFALVVVTGFLTPLNMDFAKILGFAGAYTRYAAIRSTATVIFVLLASAYSAMHVVVAWVIVGLVSTLINDVVFYLKQSIVSLTWEKVTIVCLTWIWAAFVIARAGL